MKKAALILLVTLAVIGNSAVWGEDFDTEDDLKEIYSKTLCIKCGMGKTLDECGCPLSPIRRQRIRALMGKGFSNEEIIWNFNADNIAFIHQLPQEVIRELRCPCACGETLEVCLAELAALTLSTGKLSGCPVIDVIKQDIKELQKAKINNRQIISEIGSERYQKKYQPIIASAIREEKSIKSYDLSRLPDVILDKSECTCACTETLRTCIEKMPWCKNIKTMIITAEIYLLMGLTPEEAAVSLYAPCGKMCGKKVTGRYLGLNCTACQRPVRDKAYWKEIDGKKQPYCCESCYRIREKLPESILDNVECKICSCKMKLRHCKSTVCPYVGEQKKLIKIWLLEGKTPEEIIERFKMIERE